MFASGWSVRDCLEASGLSINQVAPSWASREFGLSERGSGSAARRSACVVGDSGVAGPSTAPRRPDPGRLPADEASHLS